MFNENKLEMWEPEWDHDCGKQNPEYVAIKDKIKKTLKEIKTHLESLEVVELELLTGSSLRNA